MIGPATLVTLTADIAAAHVANNAVAVGDVGELVKKIHDALARLDVPAPEPEAEEAKPVVTARASVKPDSITCMVCGKKQKALKRHLSVAHDLTPQTYRQRFSLPDGYPMTAPNYSLQRREMAKKIGLGRKTGVTRGKRGKRAPKAAA